MPADVRGHCEGDAGLTAPRPRPRAAAIPRPRRHVLGDAGDTSGTAVPQVSDTRGLVLIQIWTGFRVRGTLRRGRQAKSLRGRAPSQRASNSSALAESGPAPARAGFRRSRGYPVRCAVMRMRLGRSSGRLGQHLLLRRRQQRETSPQRFLDDPPLMHAALGGDPPDALQQLWVEFYEHRLPRAAARLPWGHIHRGTPLLARCWDDTRNII